MNRNNEKKYPLNEIYTVWEESYGEDFEENYDGLVEILNEKYPQGITRKQLAKEWDYSYGEDMKEDYSGFYDFLGLTRREQEMLREARKLEYEMAFYEFQRRRRYNSENFVVLSARFKI